MATPLFVAGATGFTGREVVRQACERGLEVVAHVRPDSSSLARWQSRFTELGARVDTTPWEDEAMARTLVETAPSCVLALIGTTRARGRQASRRGEVEDYDSVDYGLTALLIRAALQAGIGPAPRFIYLSSVGASERSRSAYLRTRARAERELRESGLPFTVVRPSFIVGPDRDDRRPGERIGASLFDGALAVTGLLGGKRLRDRYRSISNVDLAGALVDIALDPAAGGQVVEPEQLQRGLRGHGRP
jgi:uncharacterized protein YbjT (DUF2867 family)